jgi:integrase
MSALLNVVPINAKPRCHNCLRGTDGKVAKHCAKHTRHYNTSGPVYLTQPQVNQLLDAARLEGPRDYAMVLLMIFHGLRVQELCNLTLASLNMSEGTIRIVALKNGKPTLENLRTAGTHSETKALAAWLAVRPTTAPDAPLFFRANTVEPKKMHRTSVTFLYKRLVSRLGFPAAVRHNHVLRHTLAKQTILAQRAATGNVDTTVVTHLLRHASSASASQYTKNSPAETEAAFSTLWSQVLVAR